MTRQIINVTREEALGVLRRRQQPWPGFRPATGAEADFMREQLARDRPTDGVELTRPFASEGELVTAARAETAETEARLAVVQRRIADAEARIPLADRFPDARGMLIELGIAEPAPADAPPRLDLSGIDPNSPFGRAMRGAW
ncbi:hypothetical protein LRS13_13500 [Svornostia abyssi]|uniref:Uncharacterized protein n=1 Tax=Svornostia abyssi TaxID=2898438 RepID=A0ABY5PAN0_9ACTN|nr:hypothetical protein LRS13_13500 [Parviterribacteraceae bacterium J379]